MKRERFDLALDRLPSSSWQQFEALASAFAVIEYSSLRTLASTSGDQGRDGALHMPGNENGVILQYSVTTSWEVKIRATAKRLSEEFSDVTELIYVTNQIIGPKADGIRRELRRDFNLFLDIWDRSWFLDRVNTHPQREAAAERLAEQVVDPLLAEEGIISTKAHVLTSDEAKAALVYLTLQWQDDIRDKGLTKVCFEAMVRAVLRGTDSDHRLTRAEVHSRIQSILHGTDPATLIPHVDSA